MKEEKSEDAGGIWVTVVVILFLGMLILGSGGWLLANLEDVLAPIINKPTAIPVPPTVEPDPIEIEVVSAALLAECQEDLTDALVVAGPFPNDGDRNLNADYLVLAQEAQVRMRDLVTRGRLLIDDMYRDTASLTQEKAERYRQELYDSIAEMRHRGMRDPYTRLNSELMLAYQYIDRFSDKIVNFAYAGITFDGYQGDLRSAELHLDTARELLNR
jgi:hypothetical protein